MDGIFSYGKKEKLKSRKLIEQLFATGKSFSQFPLKIFYLPATADEQNLQGGVGVSARNFKKSVDRNRIKRLLREAYRLNKNSLEDILQQKQQHLSLFFLYTGKEMPDQALINQKMRKALDKLATELVS